MQYDCFPLYINFILTFLLLMRVANYYNPHHKPNKIADIGIIVSIAALTATIPCIEMPGLWDPTQSGKLIYYLWAMLTTGLLLITRILFLPGFKIRVCSADILLFTLALYIIINRFILHRENSFSERFYQLPGMALLYISLRCINRQWIPFLFAAIMGAALYQAVLGLLQLYNYQPSHFAPYQPTGNFFNPGPYAGYLAVSFPVILGLYFFKQERIIATDRKLINQLLVMLATFCIGCILLVLPGSRSRAAWLAVIISSLYLLSIKYNLPTLIKNRFYTQTGKLVFTGCTILLIAAAGSAFYFFKKGSADGRLLAWKITTHIIADNPFTGIGPSRFKAVYMNYQANWFRLHPTDKAAVNADDIYYAFNDPLQFVAENGLIGLCLLMGIIGVFIKPANIPVQGNIARSGLLAALIFSLFSYPTAIIPITISVIIYLAILTPYSAGGITLRMVLPRLTTVPVKLTICATALLALPAVAHIKTLYNGYMNWQTAMWLYQGNWYKESTRFFEKANPVFRKEGDFLMHYGKALSMNKDHRKALAILHEATHHLNTSIIQIAMGDSYKNLKQYDSCETAYRNALYMTPERFYPKYLLAGLYYETGRRSEAIVTAQEIISHTPLVPSEAVNDMKQEMQKIIDQYRHHNTNHSPNK